VADVLAGLEFELGKSGNEMREQVGIVHLVRDCCNCLGRRVGLALAAERCLDLRN
jgi:hypothetical protein